MWAELAATAAITLAPGAYGGGIVPTASQANAGARLALMSFRVHADGKTADLYVTTTAACGRRYGTFEVELRDRVTFDDNGVLDHEDDGDATFDNSGGKLDNSWDLDAKYADGKLSGTLQLTSRRGRTRCKTGSKGEWQARNPAVGTSAAAPQPGTPYFGVTSQTVAKHYPAPIVLRTSGNGQRVDGAQWLASARCQRIRNDLFVNTTPRTTITGTSFERNERFSIRYIEGLADFRARLDGGFTDVGANGNLRLREVWHARRNDKRTVDRCDSGVVSWRAAP